jgi:hypothetical protein
MLTLFSTAKPFVGHSAVIQRNALESWRRLDPDIEIILFGDDPGLSEVCAQLGLRQEPKIEVRENGTKTLRSIFGRAQEIARHDLLCYSNCDIILTADFAHALSDVSSAFEKFLMVGRRWDLDVTQSLDFSRSGWQQEIVERARREGFQRLYYNIDYFAFRRGLYQDFPELVIGRNWWDQWLVWRAGALGASVVDASQVACAVHQNHDYSYHPQGVYGVWYGEGSHRNMEAAGGKRHLHTIEDANYRLTARGLERNRLYRLVPAKRIVRERIASIRRFFRLHFWFPVMDATRPLRHSLGLKQAALPGPNRRSELERLHPFDRGWSPPIKWDRKTRE